MNGTDLATKLIVFVTEALAIQFGPMSTEEGTSAATPTQM